ncbi:ATP-binding protein [Gillisia sp. JM1]|uniref:ATP-binding protein n=1 Tax=Gillisia sp. JM1 TaxID=1283286 RepID=UPI00041307AE|nr:ATP-binding protein [Gillisia sp. JM1]
MKKLFTTSKYKKRNLRKGKRVAKQKSRNKPYIPKNRPLNYFRDVNIKKPAVVAPRNFQLIKNTEDCLRFFKKIRSQESLSQFKKLRYIEISLTKVKDIDYSAICILIAIIDDYNYKGILLRAGLPENKKCRNFIIDSGLLNKMYDESGKPFGKADKSDHLFFTRGAKKLSREDNIRISNAVKNSVKHLTGLERHCPKLRRILLEICGNSIEWGGTADRQWLLGIKYGEDSVIFTVTDVGKGILKTLHKKFDRKVKDFIQDIPEDQILLSAFKKKYGSNTQEINRNKGLPAVKLGFDEGRIENLKVLTNNVILHFDNTASSKTFAKSIPEFYGTFYRWNVSKKCIE